MLSRIAQQLPVADGCQKNHAEQHEQDTGGPERRQKLGDGLYSPEKKIGDDEQNGRCTGADRFHGGLHRRFVIDVALEGNCVDYRIYNTEYGHWPVMRGAFPDCEFFLPDYQIGRGNHKEDDPDTDRVFERDMLLIAPVDAGLIEQACRRPHQDRQDNKQQPDCSIHAEPPRYVSDRPFTQWREKPTEEVLLPGAWFQIAALTVFNYMLTIA